MFMNGERSSKIASWKEFKYLNSSLDMSGNVQDIMLSYKNRF